MPSSSFTSSDKSEWLKPSSANGARLQPTVVDLVNNISLSDWKSLCDTTAMMPASITSPCLSISKGNDQSGTPAAMSAQISSLSEDNNATTVVFQTPQTTIEGCGVTYVPSDEETATNKKAVAGNSLGTSYTGIAHVAEPAPFVEESAKVSWALPSKNNAFMSSGSALAFLSCNENSSDELIIANFNSTVTKYPATLDFARQAVKVISDARNSNALLSWLVTEVLGDPRHSPQIGDKAAQPRVIPPLSGHIRNGIRSFPSASSRQITGFPRSNLYVELYHPDSEAHAYSGRYFCSKPVSVIVGESKQTFYVHQQVLAMSPVLEKMCNAKYVNETASIELPDDDPEIFEYVLGYLYFQDYNPPTHAPRWESATGLETPITVNDTIINTYVMAAKYELEGLKPLLLKSFNLEVPFNEFCRLVKIVYDASAYDPGLGQFFKDNVVASLEKTLAGTYDAQYGPSSYWGHIQWGGYGGRFGTDLTAALLRRVGGIQATVDGAAKNGACEDCGDVECQCDNQSEDGEYDEPGPSLYDDQHYDDDQYDHVADETYDAPVEAAQEDQAQEKNKSTGTDWCNTTQARNVNQKVETEELHSEIRADVNRLIGQLGNLQGSGWRESAGLSHKMADRQAGVAPTQSRPQFGRDNFVEGVCVNQDRHGWGSCMPAQTSHAWDPPVCAQSGSGGQTAIAVQASNWVCTLDFPAGAIITDVTPILGGYDRYSGWYGGRFGEFPGRHVQMIRAINSSGDGRWHV